MEIRCIFVHMICYNHGIDYCYYSFIITFSNRMFLCIVSQVADRMDDWRRFQCTLFILAVITESITNYVRKFAVK